ncbi:MAG: patatin-like phospholipase family protein [Chitinophagales bacterium]|nr:patatin-like phospholipase family protein [Chitinophagales bacterium]
MADTAPTFDLAFVMAGAVSAGAYTGGVMDFLFEALEEWEKEKERNRWQHGDDFSKWDVPYHNINIKALAGASAGGMTSAMTAASIAQPVNHVRTKADIVPGLKNKFFNSWVNQIDIRDLTQTEDLKKDPKLKSILDSTKIMSIAAQALGNMDGNINRPYFSKSVQLFVTVSNLRGIPYQIKFNSTDKSNLVIIQHGDYFHFEISRDGAQRFNSALFISLKNPNPEVIEILKNAGAATGAFPFGLAPVTLSRKASEYGTRFNLLSERHIAPAWPTENFDSAKYDFIFETIDGGLINNEPLELARVALLPIELKNDPNIPDAQKRNPREAKNVRASVIMIDPFPSDFVFQTDYNPNKFMRALIGDVLGTLRHQAMFKTSELIDAVNESVFSRFLIAPTRSEDQKHPIACGALGGFAGFLCEDFRMHDYFLGRRNAQRFFSKYFALPAEDAFQNDIFKNQRTQYTKYLKNDNPDSIPIIPLLGSAAMEAQAIDWPQGKIDLEDVMNHFDSRISAVTSNLISEFTSNYFQRKALQFALSAYGNKRIHDFIKKTIAKEMDDFKLS